MLLAEDHSTVARAWMRRLGYDFEVVAVVTSGEALIERVSQLHPDAILADVGLEGLDGISATVEIRRQDPAVPIVLMTGHDVSSLRLKALAAGASELLPKADVDSVVALLQQLVRGIAT